MPLLPCREHREAAHRGDACAQPLHIRLGGGAGMRLLLGGPRQRPQAPLLRQVVQGQRGVLQVGRSLSVKGRSWAVCQAIPSMKASLSDHHPVVVVDKVPNRCSKHANHRGHRTVHPRYMVHGSKLHGYKVIPVITIRSLFGST